MCVTLVYEKELKRGKSPFIIYDINDNMACNKENLFILIFPGRGFELGFYGLQASVLLVDPPFACPDLMVEIYCSKKSIFFLNKKLLNKQSSSSSLSHYISLLLCYFSPATVI